MDEESNVAVDTDTDEEVVLDDTADMEDVEAIKLKLEEAEEAKRQLTARAHKAEAELKKAKQTAPQKEIINNGLDADSVDVKILQSQGLSEDLIEQLKKLAKINGTSILAAQSDSIYQVIKERKEQEEKKAKASLGASRGSGSPTVKKDFNSPGLTEAEHRDLWKKRNG